VHIGNELVWAEETIYLFRQATAKTGDVKVESEKPKQLHLYLMPYGRFLRILVVVMRPFRAIATLFIYIT
jgi:hypothetical protein